MTAVAEDLHPAGVAFDAIADLYDSLFTGSLIGRAQRTAVWRETLCVFRPGDRILELNCGTGEDALFLAGRGIRVCACDASPRMIGQAKTRRAAEAPLSPIDFRILRTEHIDSLRGEGQFDGVFSNFSGLNCVNDLARTARSLASLVRPRANLLLCVSTRYCLWEIAHYATKGDFRRAFRRCRGFAEVHLNGHSLPVHYPTLRLMRKWFDPFFRLRSVTGIGVVVPPSYLEAWTQNHLGMLRMCEAADRMLSRLPGARVLGDHMLLHMERLTR
ncbi:MAG TPA: class I SAM-dependent methyltransferase [Acidobacteriaceae bacterium]|jgi:SAM-dependent methyltransferase|nr:class I SAM-dependent methyltransferase [Acidobacteriaceae bacterium]